MPTLTPPELPAWEPDPMRPWQRPGDHLYIRSGVYAVRPMFQLIPDASELETVLQSPMYWYADGAQPGPWSWLRPNDALLSEVREKVLEEAA